MFLKYGARAIKELAWTIGLTALFISAYVAIRAWNTSSQHAHEGLGAGMSAESPVLLAGKLLSIRGVDITKNAYSILLFTSPTCVFCSNSTSFHRTIIEEARKSGVPLWIVVPSTKSASDFLTRTGLTKAPIISLAELNGRVRGVPAVLLADSGGVIRRIWVGQLAHDEEADLLEALRNPSRVTVPRRRMPNGEFMLTPTEFRSLSRRVATRLISTQDRSDFSRGHAPGAINVPRLELAIRAERDLIKNGLNVIDCSYTEETVCSFMVEDLRKIGFRAAAVDFSESVDSM